MESIRLDDESGRAFQITNKAEFEALFTQDTLFHDLGDKNENYFSIVMGKETRKFKYSEAVKAGKGIGFSAEEITKIFERATH